MKKRLALALLLVACTAPRGETTSTTRGAIQGGSLDSSDKFAVAILDSADGVCSGTLIAPNLVLTARHCVAEGGSDPIDCAIDRFDSPRAPTSFRVSTAASNVSYDTAEYKVTKVLVPSDSLFCGNDLALAIIDTNVTGTVAEPTFDLPDVDAVTAIGYGTTAPGAADDGKRRKLASVDVACVPGIPARDCDLSSFQMAKTEMGAGAGLCEGDSGSGAYVPSSIASGKPVVVGVLSRAADDGGNCVDAVYARTDAFKKLLVDGANEAAVAGGYPLPSWAKPTSTPGTSDDAGEATPDDPGADPDSRGTKGDAPPAGSTTTTTESGCSASPEKTRGNWAFLLFVVPFIKRRRRSHSPV